MYRISCNALLLILPLLSGCQYMSYYKTNTDRANMELQESPEVVCSALGAQRGNLSFDNCVAEEEDLALRRRNRDAGL